MIMPIFSTINTGTCRRCNCRTSGFTLIELMAVTLLIAMLSSIGLISAIRTFKSWAVEENAKCFFLMAKYARIYAIENQKPCFLVIDPEQKIYFLSAPDDEAEDSDENIVIQNLWTGPQTLQPHVYFENIEKQDAVVLTDQNQIEFYPDGTAQSASVQIGDGKKHYSVTVSAGTGKARVFSGPIVEVELDQIDLDLVNEYEI